MRKLDIHIQTPEERLSKHAVPVWRISATISAVIFALILGGVYFLYDYFSWYEWVFKGVMIGAALLILNAIWEIIIQPALLYKNWRYSVDEQFLQLKSGAFTMQHQLVPMTKIQAVATNQGPLLRRYHLYSITIETMGSSHTIPAIKKEDAIILRNLIAHYAKIKEVE